MTTSKAVTDVLDETIRALAVLDLERIRILEERIEFLAQSGLVSNEVGLSAILAKKRVLELVLQSSASNLNTLNRLHGRDTRDRWAH
jgi:hypothetical protein